MADRGRYFEEVCIGEEFVTEKKVITSNLLDEFVGIVGLGNPLFTNEDYAKKSIFGGRILPGSLTISIYLAMIDNLGLFSDTLVALQSLEVTFIHPVRPGDTIQVRSKIIEKNADHEREKRRGRVILEETIINQSGQKTASVIRKILVKRKTT
jgi:3-hydroxybutyryl-CoA dehydratase